MKFSGVIDLDPYGYLRVIKIQISSIKEPANIVRKITSLKSLPNPRNGAHLMIK